MSVTFTISKADVYNEVAKVTSYSGVKKAADGSLYEQVFASSEDSALLDKYWGEATNAATELFKPFISSITNNTSYSAVLNLSASYDTNLTASAQSSLFNFFVDYIVSNWFIFTNKEDSESFGVQATAMLDDVRSKIYNKKKPTRTIPS